MEKWNNFCPSLLKARELTTGDNLGSTYAGFYRTVGKSENLEQRVAFSGFHLIQLLKLRTQLWWSSMYLILSLAVQIYDISCIHSDLNSTPPVTKINPEVKLESVERSSQFHKLFPCVMSYFSGTTPSKI